MTAGVLVMASEPVFRTGLVTSLQTHGSYRVFEAPNTQTAQELLRRHSPPFAVAVVEPSIPDISLDKLCDLLEQAYPETSSCVLLRRPERSVVQRLCRHGVRGVYDTTITPPDLIAVLHRIAAGDIAVQPSLVRYLLEPESDTSAPDVLSPREITVLQLLARGYASKQAATVLDTTPKAIDLLVERAIRRLGAAHRAEVVAIALRRGLII
jgi:DNA-binding NarL/FixJ family response regulator